MRSVNVSEEAGEEELLLIAAGRLRPPKNSIKVDELLRIPTGRVAHREGTQALLEERAEGL